MSYMYVLSTAYGKAMLWQLAVKDNADRFLFHKFLDLSLVVMKPVSLVPKMKDVTWIWSMLAEQSLSTARKSNMEQGTFVHSSLTLHCFEYIVKLVDFWWCLFNWFNNSKVLNRTLLTLLIKFMRLKQFMEDGERETF